MRFCCQITCGCFWIWSRCVGLVMIKQRLIDLSWFCRASTTHIPCQRDHALTHLWLGMGRGRHTVRRVSPLGIFQPIVSCLERGISSHCRLLFLLQTHLQQHPILGKCKHRADPGWPIRGIGARLDSKDNILRECPTHVAIACDFLQAQKDSEIFSVVVGHI